MNENYSKQKRHRTPENEFSIWFLASRIGKTFHSQAARRLGGLNQIDEGIWRSQILDRYLFFVSGVDLPVDHDSVPFHILGVETAKKEEEAASLIANDEMLWEMYSQFLGSLHSSTLKELIAMAKTARNGPKFQIKPLVEFMGMQETITQIGEDQVLDHFASDPKRMKKALAFFLNRLSNSEREEIRRKLK